MSAATAHGFDRHAALVFAFGAARETAEERNERDRLDHDEKYHEEFQWRLEQGPSLNRHALLESGIREAQHR